MVLKLPNDWSETSHNLLLFQHSLLFCCYATATGSSSSSFVIPFYLSGDCCASVLLFLLSMLLNMVGSMQDVVINNSAQKSIKVKISFGTK